LPFTPWKTRIIAMLLGNLLSQAARRTPGKSALIFDGKAWTYEELDEISQRVAASLLRAGIQSGDRVALFLRNCPEMVFSYYGCFKAGAIVVPLNNRYQGPEVAYAVNHSGARIIIVQHELFPEVARVLPVLKSVERYLGVGGAGTLPDQDNFAALLEDIGSPEILPSVRENDPAIILYTSGSTARPKGVVHTHFSLTHTIINQSTFQEMDSREVSLVVLSICHIAGLAGQLLTTAAGGGTVVLLPQFEAGKFLAAIDSHCPTKIQLLPEQVLEILDHPQAPQTNFSSLQCCIAGGDSVPLEVHRRFRELAGLEITETCGATESFSYAMNPPFGLKKPGSIGKPVHGTTLRIVDDADRGVAPGQAGEILVKSRANMLAYWHNPQETAKTLKNSWLYTGDLGRVDEDGYYWFVGRKKNIIIRGGSNIAPGEVEAVLFQHPAVKDTCVVGKPDPAWGQTVTAYVSVKEDFAPPTAEDLHAFAAERLAAYKVPEEIVILPDLPLNPIGKVDRQRLAAWAASGR
jgi:long-chain acyl-CoA synthetase